MVQIISVLHLLICLALIALIVLQRGKGAEAGAAFGGGASQTVFGSRGAGTFLLKITGAVAVLFFASTLTLNVLAKHNIQAVEQNDILDLPSSTTPASIPAQEATPTTTPETNAANGSHQIPTDLLELDKTQNNDDK